MLRHFITWILLLVLAGSFAVVSLGSPADDETNIPRKEVSTKTAKAATPPRYTPEQQALMAIQEEGRVQVRELADRIKTETDPERRAELDRQAIEIKKQTRIRFLETLAGFARQRGDEVIELQAMDQIENIKNPPRVTGTPIRQTPDKSEVRKGAK